MKVAKITLAALALVAALVVVGLAYFAVVVVLLAVVPFYGASPLTLILLVSLVLLTACAEAVKHLWSRIL